MAPESRPAPDLILLGDSHVLALKYGCDALGLNAAMLKSGGIHWNAGRIRVFRRIRNRSPMLPALKAEVPALEQQLGRRNVFDGPTPVIASVGFHCGHLTRAFGAMGHVAWPPPPEVDAGLFASTALVEAFVEEQRAVHFQLLRHIAALTKLTVILPPRAPKNADKPIFRHNLETLTDAITRRMRALGLDVYDPNEEIVDDASLLPREMVEADGFHGTPDYGRRVMEQLIARGALAEPLAEAQSPRGNERRRRTDAA